MHLTDDELITGLADQVPGETIHAAVYARVDTALGFTRMLTPLGNYLVARPAARAAARKVTVDSGVPLDAAVVLALSGSALHLWSADPLLDQVHDHLGHVPVGQISGMRATPGRSWQALTIDLVGGHQIELSARGAAHALVAAFERVTAPGER